MAVPTPPDSGLNSSELGFWPALNIHPTYNSELEDGSVFFSNFHQDYLQDFSVDVSGDIFSYLSQGNIYGASCSSNIIPADARTNFETAPTLGSCGYNLWRPISPYSSAPLMPLLHFDFNSIGAFSEPISGNISLDIASSPGTLETLETDYYGPGVLTDNIANTMELLWEQPTSHQIPEPSVAKTTSKSSWMCTHCSKSFPRACDLRVHEQRHHLKSFQCPQCAKAHGAKRDLERHIWSQHPKYASDHQVPTEKRTCRVCGKEARRDNLKRHMRTVHGIGNL